MADDDKLMEQEEYQFAEEETEASSNPFGTTATAEPEESMGAIVRNGIFGLIVLTGIFFGFYQLYGLFFKSSKAPEQPAATFVAQPTVEKPMVEAPVQPVVQQSALGNSQWQMLEERLQKLADQAEANQNMMSTMQQRLSAMQLALSSVTNKLGEANQALQDLQEKMKPKPIPESIKKMIRKSPKRRRARTVPRTMYFIQAMIPGRAWLKGKNGSTITVGKGSRLPGYGRVQRIDPKAGTVVMSSGVVIRYSAADS